MTKREILLLEPFMSDKERLLFDDEFKRRPEDWLALIHYKGESI